MAINPNNGVLDIINGTLKVSSIDIKQAGGFTTAINTVARNDVLLYDDQHTNTTFTPTQNAGYSSSSGVTRDTTAIDFNDGWVYWPLQLPNSWHTEFDILIPTTGGVLTYSLFNTSEPNHTDYTANDGGYKIVFDNTQNQIDIRWEGSVHATTSANVRSADWQHVNINYFQGAVSISLAGKVVLTHKFTENYQEFDSRYVGFSATSGASHKIRHLIVHNSDKWLYTKTSHASDISYVSGNVGIGTLEPTELLDVHGNVHIAKDLTVDGNLTVSGTTTFIDTQNLAIEDPIIEVARGNASDTIDAGLVITRATSNVAVAYRGDEEELALGYTQSGASDTDVTPIADGGLDVRVYGNLFANNLTTTANVEATYLKGNGSEITHVTLDQVVDYGNTTANTIHLTNEDVGLKVDGNVEANYFIGNGSLLDGISSTLQEITDNGNVTTNTIQFTNTTTAFIADSNVGIGTDTPSANLHVVGHQYVNDPPTLANSFDHSDAPLTLTHGTPTSTTAIDDPKPVLHLTRDGTQNEAYGARASFNLSRYENSGTASRSRLDVALTDGTYAESNVMSIRADGKVGIGTTAPGYTLDVDGDINLSGDFYQGGSPFVSSLWTDSQDSLYYRSNVEVGTSNLFVDTTTSRVGIGTTAPGYTLDVHGTANVGALTATSISGPLSGNAGTATALETARTIGGVSFDGTANIDLPGVNTTGNQDTTGNAGTATALETARTIGGVSFDGTANIDLPGVNTTGNQDTTGNADTATALETARTIGGVSFDGTANIDLPGVNTSGNQDTTGNADTATALETARTIGGVSFDGTANIDLPGVNTSGNQDTTGNADTATALETARTIGGVSFDGTANIDLPGVNTSGNQDTTGNADTATALETARTINGVSFNGSANITVEPYISNDDTGDTNCPIVFTANSTAGYKRLYEDSTLYFNNTANILYSPTFSGSLSGNADTATALETGRNINGVSFNGSANITVNGLNYDVNNGWLRENGDNANFKQYGNARQMVFRTDGTSEYASGVGGYPFVWMYGGDAVSNRRMLLNTSGQLWCSNYGWLHDKFMARTQVFSDTNANANFDGQKIDYNASGSQTTTADRVHRALYIDMDSTATGGDTNHEHRMYGIYSDVRHSGDSDIVSGMYSYARSDHTSGTTTVLRGGEFNAIASGTGTNTTIYGITAYALKDGGSTGTTATMYGVRGEVEVDAGTCTTAYAFQSHIDRDGGTITTGYLYYGSYSGTVGTKWGVYVTGETKNYFSGNVGIGTTTPGYKLEVNGTSQFNSEMKWSLGTYTSHAGYSTNKDWYIRSGEAAGKVIIQDTGGNVGIGLSSPAYKLDVSGTLHAGNSYFDNVYIGGSTSRGLRSVTGNYGTVQTTGGGAGNWEGYSIDGRYVFMSENNNHVGIYNDLDNKWILYAYRNTYVRLYYAGSTKLETNNGGVTVTGTVTATTFSGTATTATTATNQSGGTVSCTSGNFSGTFAASSASSRDKFRVYPSSQYCIGMQSGVTYGDLNDWSMTFQMNNEDDRGFWWGDDGHGVNQGAMALSTRGWLNVAERIKVGGGQTDTGAASYPLHVVGESYYSSRMYLHQSGAGGGQNLFTGLDGTTSANGRAQLVLSSAYSDLVIASSQANNNHGSTLSFTTYNPSNAADYRKFVINQGNWGTRKQFLDFGYANSTRANPHTYINSTDTVLTLDGYNKRVGIGTTNPSEKLQVQNGHIIMTGAWQPGDYYRLMGYNTGKQIQFNYNDGTWISDNNKILFGVGGSQDGKGIYWERMRIANNGNVGVGTTNPTYKMHVNGSMYYAGGGNYGSDDRIKYNEQNVSNALTLISQLQPQKYEKIVEIPSSAEGHWIPTDEEWENVKNEYEYDDEYGFIAQDVRAIPELSFLVTGEETRTDTKIVTLEEYSNLTTQEQNTYSLSYINENITITPDEYSNLASEESNSYTVGYTKQIETDAPLGLNYNGIFVVAVAAIQELKAQLDAALARLDALENPPS